MNWSILDEIGEQVTWNMLKCEGKWYVTASHNPHTKDGFKVNESGEILEDVVIDVCGELIATGPYWIRKLDTEAGK